MGSVNKVFLLGNLGQQPEVRDTSGGREVCTLRVATSERWVKDGERQERTEWHTVVCWEGQARACRHLSKGSSVHIEGTLRTRRWEDDEGRERFATEVIASRLTFVGSRVEQPDGVPF